MEVVLHYPSFLPCLPYFFEIYLFLTFVSLLFVDSLIKSFIVLKYRDTISGVQCSGDLDRLCTKSCVIWKYRTLSKVSSKRINRTYY